MGLSVSTTKTFEYVFVEDRTLPADEQRTLICKFLSARDYNRVDALFEEASEQSESISGMVAKVIEGLRVMLVGWRNMGIDYDPNDIDAALAVADLNDVRRELLQSMTLSHLEKKASALRSQSTTVNSANAGPTVV